MVIVSYGNFGNFHSDEFLKWQTCIVTVKGRNRNDRLERTFYISEFSVIVALLDDSFDNRPVRESPCKTFPRAQRAERPAKIVKIRILMPHISLFSF